MDSIDNQKMQVYLSLLSTTDMFGIFNLSSLLNTADDDAVIHSLCVFSILWNRHMFIIIRPTDCPSRMAVQLKP